MKSEPGTKFFMDLQDEEDEDAAALQAARLVSNAMMENAMARKGM